MKRIAVATDLSVRSDRAIERALALAHDLNAELTVISIVDDSMPADLAETVAASTRDKLRKVLDQHKGASADIDVRVGDIVPGILGIAAETDADLLVLGLHRRRDFMDALRQTTMERIVALSRIPVLLVQGAVTGPYEKVLVAVTLSRACASAVSSAGRIVPGAEIRAVHALHIPYAGLTGATPASTAAMEKAMRREAGELAEAWQRDFGLTGVEPEIITGSVHQVLDAELKSFAPQLLSIGAHTRSGLGLHRLGAFTAELIRQPPVDLLVARALTGQR